MSVSLPPELWLRIFSEATATPGLLDSDSEFTSDLPIAWVRQQERRTIKDSLQTKRALVLVCKDWNSLASEFLYQSILITRVDALRPLLKSLKASAMRSSTTSTPTSSDPDSSTPTQESNAHSVPHGFWTRRLDVTIQEDRCEAAHYDLLAQVIGHLRSLAVFTLAVPMLPFNDVWIRHVPVAVLDALVRTSADSLRVFDCAESILRPSRNDLMLLLSATRNLRVLRCPICSPTPGDKYAASRAEVPLMPSLESLSLMSVFVNDYLPRSLPSSPSPSSSSSPSATPAPVPEPRRTPYPMLRQLSYDSIPPPFYDTRWNTFLSQHCANITSVRIDFSLPAYSLQREFDLLEEHCPRLSKIAITFVTWETMKPNFVLPGTVRELALCCKVQVPPPAHVRALLLALKSLRGGKLEMVRLCCGVFVRELRENHGEKLREAGEVLKKRGGAFRVEDEEGGLLIPL